ncbi:hypothetical protein U9M48_002066 [Paspalum notatum var. saurae]|uniref:Uncharacterized protein n=1 Tax=Paspalum notatum var. saurae TaxID=547442 RepID=A0AAQ3PQM3_PASNO
MPCSRKVIPGTSAMTRVWNRAMMMSLRDRRGSKTRGRSYGGASHATCDTGTAVTSLYSNKYGNAHVRF